MKFFKPQKDVNAAVNSVSNSDGTLTISPTTGAVVASLNLGHANTWTATQTFNSSSNPQIAVASSTSGSSYINFSGGRVNFGYNGTTANATISATTGKGIEFAVNSSSFGSGIAAVITNAGNVGIGTTAPTGLLTLAGNKSATTWGVNGINFQVAAATYTDTSSSGTVASNMVNTIGTPTLAASSATTYTNASTVYIDGAPSAGSNVTISNSYALYVNNGNAYFGGALTAAGTITTNGNLSTGSVGSGNLYSYFGGTVSTSFSQSQLQFGGSSNVNLRNYLGSAGSSTAITTGNNYANTVIGSSPLTTAASGTHAWLANAVINPLGTVTSGGATVTNTATLYVGPAGSGGTNNYSLALAGTIGYYNGVATTGNGVPSIYGTGRLTAQTSTVASVATYTVGASDASFWVSGNVNCTAFTSGSLNLQVTYTDETNTSQTVTMQGHFTSGYGTSVTGTGAFEVQPIHIRAKAATTITIKTAGTFVLTYNVEGIITKIA